MKNYLAARVAALSLLAALGAIAPWLDQQRPPAAQIPVHARPQHNLAPISDRQAEAQAAAAADALYASMSDAERLRGIVYEPTEDQP